MGISVTPETKDPARESAVTPGLFRALRQRLGSSQEELGGLLGLSRTSIALRESGKRTIRPEEFDHLQKLVAIDEGSPIMDVDALRDPSRPVPVDLRPLRAALEAIELDALGASEQSELALMLAAAQRATVQYPAGWVRSDARACPRVVAGLECHTQAGERDRQDCVCQGALTLDHVKMWTVPGGAYALTSEPYSLDGEDFASFIAICKGLGLSVQVRATSPHFPTETLLVTITRKAEGDGEDDL